MPYGDIKLISSNFTIFSLGLPNPRASLALRYAVFGVGCVGVDRIHRCRHAVIGTHSDAHPGLASALQSITAGQFIPRPITIPSALGASPGGEGCLLNGDENGGRCT